MLNPIFSKKVQGQKHPGRCGIVEHQIPIIKMLFKTNTKSHKHPSIRLLSKSKTQLVNQRKQKVAFSPGTAYFPIERDGVQLRQYWMKWQSEIAYLPKFPKTMTNLLMIMISMLMIKNILKFKILIMMLPTIMTHSWEYVILYHVRWYHCSKQELRKLWSNFWKIPYGRQRRC